MTKLPYTAPKLTKLTDCKSPLDAFLEVERLQRSSTYGKEVRLTVADLRAALEECSSCCLDEPEEVEKVLAVITRRAR
jgi:hypothetical protein